MVQIPFAINFSISLRTLWADLLSAALDVKCKMSCALAEEILFLIAVLSSVISASRLEYFDCQDREVSVQVTYEHKH